MKKIHAILLSLIFFAGIACSDLGGSDKSGNKNGGGSGGSGGSGGGSATELSLNKSKTSIVKGNTEQLTASSDDIVWTSSNSNASVSSNGLVTANTSGSAIITAELTSDSSVSAFCVVTVTDSAVSVTGVSLNKTRTTMAVGAAETLVATLMPTNATDQVVTWSSSNTSAATVSGGVVTAVAAGSATITVTTNDGSYASTCAVTVLSTTYAVSSVSLNKSATCMLVSGTETLYASINPAFATSQNVTWTSDATGVAIVDQAGTVTGVSTGAAVITVKTEDGGYTDSCTVTVTNTAVAVTDLSLALSKTTAYLVVGGCEQLSAEISPETSTNQNVTWSSSDKTVATVDQTGLVTGVAVGSATITVTSAESSTVKTTCSVTVASTGNNWADLKGSQDGKRLVAIARTGYSNAGIFTSNDYGYTWKQVYNKSVTYWSLACSSDAKHIITISSYVSASLPGGIYTSDDYGETWTDRSSGYGVTFTSVQLQSCGISDDGKTMLAAAYQGYIYVSTDSGATWASKGNSGNWVYGACSGDGTTMFTGSAYASGKCMYSVDSGSTWTNVYPNTSYCTQVRGVVISPDGSQVALASHGGHVYLGNYSSGWTWTDVSPISSTSCCWQNINAIFGSDDKFATLYVGDCLSSAGYLYKTSALSTTSATWTQITTKGAYWRGAIGSPEGNIISALAEGDGIYITIDGGTTWTRRY